VAWGREPGRADNLERESLFDLEDERGARVEEGEGEHSGGGAEDAGAEEGPGEASELAVGR
jgi:hypothetical protein